MPEIKSAKQIDDLNRQKAIAKMLLAQSIDHYLEALEDGALWDRNDDELTPLLKEALSVLRQAGR